MVTGPPSQGVALAGLGADREQADARVLETEPGPGVGRAGEAVLGHHGGRGVGGGAHVEQHDGVGEGGDDDGQRRPADTAYAAEA